MKVAYKFSRKIGIIASLIISGGLFLISINHIEIVFVSYINVIFSLLLSICIIRMILIKYYLIIDNESRIITIKSIYWVKKIEISRIVGVQIDNSILFEKLNLVTKSWTYKIRKDFIDIELIEIKRYLEKLKLEEESAFNS